MHEISPSPDTNPRPWSSFSLDDAQAWASTRNLPRYRGRQLFDALHKRAVQDISEVLEFPLSLRETLAAEAPTRSLRRRAHLTSARDQSQKALLALADGTSVEAVLIPSGVRGTRRRYTVCVSSQVGCPAACTFCATGIQGFTRNLTATEIVDQVMYFASNMGEPGLHVSNVVFMGMGEPLLNVEAVRQAVEQLTDPRGFGLGDRHITVSTVGIVPQIQKFASWAGQVNLAISLHAPDDDLRTRLVSYNRHFPIADIMCAVEEYIAFTRRRVSFEYVLLHGVNDGKGLASDLARLLRPLRGMAHVNVIPWNPFREGKFVRSEGPDADTFVTALRAGGVNATVRYSKGLDISGACGQLRDRETTSATV